MKVTDAKTAESKIAAILVAELRHLVSLHAPENGGPYGGYAADRCMKAMARAADALTAAEAEIKVLRGGLTAAIRAANLALFVIRKQGIMPNSSWEAGFNSDLAKAEAARAEQEKKP